MRFWSEMVREGLGGNYSQIPYGDVWTDSGNTCLCEKRPKSLKRPWPQDQFVGKKRSSDFEYFWKLNNTCKIRKKRSTNQLRLTCRTAPIVWLDPFRDKHVELTFHAKILMLVALWPVASLNSVSLHANQIWPQECTVIVVDKMHNYAQLHNFKDHLLFKAILHFLRDHSILWYLIMIFS